MNRRYTLLALLVCCVRFSDTNASALGVRSATEEAPKAIISRSASRITIDGVLDEPDWGAATPIGEIRQREPHQGEKASEATEVKLLYDSQNLYIGVMCFDSDPTHIIGTQMSRDADLSADDRIEILIDSFRDRHNAFYFATNPLGALVDALIIENGQINKEWDDSHFERLFEPFEIAQGVTLPVGDYRFTRWCFQINTASKRRWKFDNEWWLGSFWSGHANQFETGFQYKVAPHFQTGIALEQTFARLTEGKCAARVFILRGDYSVSPLLTFFNLVQFDNQRANLGWQSRVHWTLRPGNDTFLVFSQGWLQDEARGQSLQPTDTKIAGRVQYTFRF